MGREYRSIVLSQNEFETAVNLYYEQTQGAVIHPSNIRALELTENPDFACQIDLIEPLLDGKKRITLDSAEIIDVIQRFVRNKGHPLPRRGRKSLAWMNGQLSMLIELDWF